MAHTPSNPNSRDDRVDQVILEYLQAVDAGARPNQDAIIAQHPDLADEIRAFFADEQHVGNLARPLRKWDSHVSPLDETLVEADPSRYAKADGLPEPIGGYRPIRLLGVGGMGRVYEAEDASGRRVALKLISPSFATSHIAIERFRQEGRLASMIAHPRCVFVLAADEDAGQPYIVMELMTGQTLKDLVDRNGPLSPTEAVRKIMDVMEGLEEAHQAGVIHRDVKPGNCYMAADGRVKIGDFGLSRSLSTKMHLTQTGGFVGTPLFASPEQLKGETLDARTDVYSVAATLNYLLTGQAPFQHAEAATVIARVVSEAAPSPRTLRPDILPALERIVLRGLERQRDRRFQSLAEFREALQPLLGQSLTIAGIGLRVGAYLLDGFLFGLLGEVHATWSMQHGGFPHWPTHWLLAGAIFLYFWLSEGIWGRSPAKWLVGLRVTRVDSQEPPGLGRAFIRTATLFLIDGMLIDIVVFFMFNPRDQYDAAVYALIRMAGGFAGVLICFSFARARNGYRGLHEFASGTRTISVPAREQGTLRLPASVPSFGAPAAARKDERPTSLGPFRVRGVVQEAGAESLLLGEDPSLGRRVWLWLRPEGATAVPTARRDVARSTRPRWVTAGTHNGRQWDAFVAPLGQPSPEVVKACGPLAWPVARRILEQLAEELTFGIQDGTLPAALTVEQIWIQASGRIQLLDWPAHEPTAGGDNEARALALFRQVATLVLEGKARPSDDARPIRAPLPLHARAVMQRLIGVEKPYERIAPLREELATTRDRPTHVTTGLRALQMVLSFVFLSVGLASMLIWSRMGAIAEVIALELAMARNAAVTQMLTDDALRAELRSELVDGHVLQNNPEPVLAQLRQRLSVDRAERDKLRRELGPVDVFAASALQQRFVDPDQPIRIERAPGEVVMFMVVRATGETEQPLELTPADINSVLHYAAGGEDPSAAALQEALLWSSVFSLSFFPVFWIVWAFLFRGPISVRVAGLALVRSDGRKAARWQCALRAFFIWAPVVIPLAIILWLDRQHLATLPMCTLLQGLSVGILVAYVVLALRFPRQSYADWLAGVQVAPR